MELRRSTDKARNLRSASTDAERALWTRLRGRRLGDFKFRRQYPVSGFIVDFACLESHVVVELDGSQHFETSDYDTRRTTVLQKSGFRVIRFWDNDVLKELERVLEEILRQLQAPPSPQPSPASGRGG